MQNQQARERQDRALFSVTVGITRLSGFEERQKRQMFIDYRRFNSVTKLGCVLFCRLDIALDAFADAAVFSSIDLVMAYDQVLVKPSDFEKTGFIKHVDLYEMVKMPFKLCNDQSTYNGTCPVFYRA